MIVAQANSTASISGLVLSEEGRTLRAAVTVSFAAPRGFPSPPRRVITSPNGAFTFPRLSAGKYVLCAQISPAEAAPADSPFIDTCVWGSAQVPITVAAGEQVAGIVFTAPRGAWLPIRVIDPEHVLPAVAAKGPAPLESELQLMVKGDDGLYRHASYISSDGAGRKYQIAIPLKTAFGMKVHSSVADAFDDGGKQLDEKDDIPVKANSAAEAHQMTVTLHRKK